MSYTLIPFGQGSEFLKVVNFNKNDCCNKPVILGRNTVTFNNISFGIKEKYSVNLSRNHVIISTNKENDLEISYLSDKTGNYSSLNDIPMIAKDVLPLHVNDTIYLLGALNYFGYILNYTENIDNNSNIDNFSDNSSGIDSNREIKCSICYHDLNNYVYKILSHPLLKIPLCIECFENISIEIESNDNTIYDNVCTWCFDGGDLFECDKCHHSHCKDCLLNNFNEEYVNDIDNNDIFYCFECNPTQIKDLVDSVNIGRDKSIYNNYTVESFSFFLEEHQKESHDEFIMDGYDLYYDVLRLRIILQEIEKSLNMLEPITIDKLRSKIENETSDEDVIQNDIESYKLFWDKHYNILLHQEAEISELLQRHHFDLKRLPELNILLKIEENSYDNLITPDEKEMYKRDFSITSHSPEESISDSDSDESFSDVSIIIPLPGNSTQSVNVDKIMNDEIVMKYEVMNDIDSKIYPKSFERIVLKPLLKALYYASEEGNDEDLIYMKKTYDIIDAIIIIMKYAHNSLDNLDTAKYWSIYNKVHPSVIKALYHSTSPVEYDIISEAFGLVDSIADIDDCGEVEIPQLDSRNRGSPNKSKMKISHSDIISAMRSENLAIENGKFSKRQRERMQISFTEKDDIKDNYENKSYSTPNERVFKSIKEKGENNNNKSSRISGNIDYCTPIENEYVHHSNYSFLDKTEDLGEKQNLNGVYNDSRNDPKKDNKIIATFPKFLVPLEIDDDDYSDININNDDVTDVDFQYLSNKKVDRKFLCEDADDEKDNNFQPIYDNYDNNKENSTDKARNIIDNKAEKSESLVDLTINDSDSDFSEIFYSKSYNDHNKSSSSSKIRSSHLRLTHGISLASKPIRKEGAIGEKRKSPYESVSNQFNSKKPRDFIGIKSSVIAFGNESYSDSDINIENYFIEKENSLYINKKTKNEEAVLIISTLESQLKPHQKEAIRFLWSNCMLSLVKLKKGHKGSGCIIAHSMGLGKTLTTISFCATMLTNPKITNILADTKDIMSDSINKSDTMKNSIKAGHLPRRLIHCILILAPVNTLQNWVTEFKKWIPHELLTLLKLTSIGDIEPKLRLEKLKKWHSNGGILILGYELYRTLTGDKNKEANEFRKYLQDPGPDLVIADEAHIIKNHLSATSKALYKIRTLRRIALTGTPLQNNLIEYHTMVSWVRDGFLNTLAHFRKAFIEPIKEGQSITSSNYQVSKMKKRVYVLTKKLKPIIDRKDFSILANDLKPKREFVISIKLSSYQELLYKKFMTILMESLRKIDMECCAVFYAFQGLMRLCGHPGPLAMHELRQSAPKKIFTLGFLAKEMAASVKQADRIKDKAGDYVKLIDVEDSILSQGDQIEDSINKFKINDNLSNINVDENNLDDFNEESELVVPFDYWRLDSVSDSTTQQLEPMQFLHLGPKLIFFLNLLMECVQVNDKILLFSQSLVVLDFIDAVLRSENWGEKVSTIKCDYSGFSRWSLNNHYCRLDGGTKDRQQFIDKFNSSKKMMLFLISTRAGNMGINLVSANRVVLFDSSWNPAQDLQATFRVYRYGQTKHVFLYRFLGAGTIEEKLYRQQVQKQALSNRVIDEEMPDNHFHSNQNYIHFNFSKGLHEESQDEDSNNYLGVPNQIKDVSIEDLDQQISEKLLSGTADTVLYQVVSRLKHMIRSIEDHELLLEDNEEAHLNEEEEKAAELEFEREVNPKPIILPLPKPPILETLVVPSADASTREKNMYILMKRTQDALLENYKLQMKAYNKSLEAAAAFASSTENADHSEI